MSIGLGLELRQEIAGTYKNVILSEEQSGDGQGPDALCLRRALRTVRCELEWVCVGAERQKERGR